MEKSFSRMPTAFFYRTFKLRFPNLCRKNGGAIMISPVGIVFVQFRFDPVLVEYSCAMKSHFRKFGESDVRKWKSPSAIMRVYSRNALFKPYTSRIDLSCSASMLCDVYSVTVMSNTVNDRICQRTGITTKLIIPFFEFYTGNRKSLKIFCVSGGAVQRYPFVLNPLVSMKPFIENQGQPDWHT